ncbi:hypothetical protein BGZ76_011019 [Entomortierella beljakovae]|nr:hypothetical protein BGZ76_011019 [Entomortierella beljakovae]
MSGYPQEFPEVIIVGAGLGGLMMGLLLERMGAPYTIIEGTPKPKALGTALICQGNILAALDQLGFMDEMTKMSRIIKPFTILDSDLQQVGQVEWKERKEVSGYDYFTFSRYKLHALLFGKIPTHKIHMGKKVLRYEEVNDKVIVHCVDGTTYKGDILLGADGVHSRVRTSMYSQLSEKNLLPVADTKPDIINYTYTAALVTPKYPSKYPQLNDPISKFTIVLGGNMLSWIVIPLVDNQMCWALIKQFPSLEEARKDDPLIAEKSLEAAQSMMNNFKDFPCPFGGKMGDLFEDTKPENISKVFIEDVMHETWHHGRTALLGDGAINAMQDAIVLSNCIYDMRDNSSESIDAAFKEYKKQRFQFAKDTRDESNEVGSLVGGQTWSEKIFRFLFFKLAPYSLLRGKFEKSEAYRPQVNWLPMVKAKGSGAPVPQAISQRYSELYSRQEE